MRMEAHHNLLVRYDCGCIGFRPAAPDPNNRQSIILRFCDDDGSQRAGMAEQDMTGKCFASLIRSEEEAVFDILNELLGKGQKFEEMKSLLGIR